MEDVQGLQKKSKQKKVIVKTDTEIQAKLISAPRETNSEIRRVKEFITRFLIWNQVRMNI